MIFGLKYFLPTYKFKNDPMYRNISLHPLLVPYVSEILIQDLDDTETMSSAYRVFPTPYPVMGFQYRGKLDVIQDNEKVPLSQTGVTGLQTSTHWFSQHEDTRTILVKFFPHSLFSMLRHPINEITDRHLGLESFLRLSQLRLFEEQLSEAKDVEKLESLVQNFLIAHIQTTTAMTSDVLEDATRRILATHGRIRIELLAQDYNISRRQLERHFQFYAGMSPKDFASLVRFNWSVGHMPNYGSHTELALAAGYSDQAHLSRHFMRYAGLTPNQFRKMASE